MKELLKILARIYFSRFYLSLKLIFNVREKKYGNKLDVASREI